MENEAVITITETPITGKYTPAPAFNRAPLSCVQSHYRTKIFAPKVGMNPMVTIASSILTLVTKLRTLDNYSDASTLYTNLIHEIKAFESQAQGLNYRAEMILIARYILASCLDETIANSPWGLEGNWQHHKLLMYFQQEEWGGERFFVILERLCEEPMLHIDLLELMYLVMSLGYEGKFRFLERGHLELATIQENLYQKILQYRLELKPELSPRLLIAPAATIIVKRSLLPFKLFLISALISILFVHVSISGLLRWEAQQFMPSTNISSTFNLSSILQ